LFPNFKLFRLYSSALPPVSRLGGSVSRLDRDDQRYRKNRNRSLQNSTSFHL
jgi:hypothetical protein